MIPDLVPDGPAPQIRQVPSLRVLRSFYMGPGSGVGAALDSLSRQAVLGGVGPCGPAIVHWAELPVEGANTSVQAELLVPVRGTPSGDEALESVDASDDGTTSLVALGPTRVATIHYSGPSGALLRLALLDLFSWMDAHAHPRAGSRHFRAYLSGLPGGEAVGVALRVPLIGGGAPRPRV